MVTFIRTLSSPAKLADAMTLNQQLTKLASKKFDLECEHPNRRQSIPHGLDYIVSKLEEFNAMSIKLNPDADHQKLIAAGVAVFVAGSVHDELRRSV